MKTAATSRSKDSLLGVKQCRKLRTTLKKNLKDKFPSYLAAVLQWIRRRQTKIQLDFQVSKLLDEPMRKTHLDFLASLSKICWGASSLRIETITPSTLPEESIGFQKTPADVESQDENVLFRKKYADLSIPGIQLIRARLFLAAWESGIENVDSKVSRLLYIAMKNFVKDIIQTACLIKDPSIRTKSHQGLSFWWALNLTNRDRPTVQYSTHLDSYQTTDSPF